MERTMALEEKDKNNVVIPPLLDRLFLFCYLTGWMSVRGVFLALNRPFTQRTRTARAITRCAELRQCGRAGK